MKDTGQEVDSVVHKFLPYGSYTLEGDTDKELLKR